MAGVEKRFRIDGVHLVEFSGRQRVGPGQLEVRFRRLVFVPQLYVYLVVLPKVVFQLVYIFQPENFADVRYAPKVQVLWPPVGVQLIRVLLQDVLEELVEADALVQVDFFAALHRPDHRPGMYQVTMVVAVVDEFFQVGAYQSLEGVTKHAEFEVLV